MNVWVDIINPSHALFFNSLLKDFQSDNFFITVRDRAETFGLVKSFGMNGAVIGKDYRNEFKKSFNSIWRTFQLYSFVNSFDYALSFENGMSVTVSKLRRKKSIFTLGTKPIFGKKCFGEFRKTECPFIKTSPCRISPRLK